MHSLESEANGRMPGTYGYGQLDSISVRSLHQIPSCKWLETAKQDRRDS